MKVEEAFLSSSENYTIFKFKDYVIRFLAPYSLERYTKVKEWDNGYLVVEAKYKHRDEAEEEYIDIIPVLDSLYFETDKFLKPIKKVSVRYD